MENKYCEVASQTQDFLFFSGFFMVKEAQKKKKVKYFKLWQFDEECCENDEVK